MMKFGNLRWPDSPAALNAVEWKPRGLLLDVIQCGHCEEAIGVGEPGYVLPSWGMPDYTAYHELCLMRTILGSMNHQEGRCRCYNPELPVDSDPADMTRRQAARAAVMLAMGKR